MPAHVHVQKLDMLDIRLCGYCHVPVRAMLSLLLHSQSSWPLGNAQIHQKASGESVAPRELFHMRIYHRKWTLSFPQ